MKFQKIRIDEAGWSKFTGELCGAGFTNGMSDEPVPQMVMNQIGAIMRVTALDDDAQVGAAVSLKSNEKSAVADVVTDSDTDEPALSQDNPDYVVSDEEAQATLNCDSPDKKEHTVESLSAIADERGIAGLREIAEPLGVKGRGIAELIREILEHQKDN